MNWKKTLLTVGPVLMLGIVRPLRAQTGCDDSPEDPTLVLALMASAGALAARYWACRRRKQ